MPQRGAGRRGPAQQRAGATRAGTTRATSPARSRQQAASPRGDGRYADAAHADGQRTDGARAGQRTREVILREAASLATIDGLEGLSIGNLAAAIGMSKSGLYAHFGSKEELQLATVEEAGRIFHAAVVEPALAAAPGLAQLVAFCDAFLDHLQQRTFPGGCFFSGAALEMGTRPGRVKELVAAFYRGFAELIQQFAATAVEQGELPPDEDPKQLAFELNGALLAADANFVLHDDAAVLDVARRVVRRRLGVSAPTRKQARRRTG